MSIIKNKENKLKENNNNNYSNNTTKNLNKDFYIESTNKENISNNYESETKEIKEEKENTVHKSSGDIGFSFLNDYTSFNEKDKEKEKEKKKEINKINAELIELKENI